MNLLVIFLLFVLLVLIIFLIWCFGASLFAGKLKKGKFSLKRSAKNPIIKPQKESYWQAEGTFNPAAVKINDNTHIFYRAVGRDGVSRVGHASTKNGIDVDESSPYPVYQPTVGFDLPSSEEEWAPREYNPAFYTSGGGWGGCEDPRTVKIGDRIYMTYVAFGGWNSVRIALTSISADDLEKNRWNWSKPVFLSPPGQMNKNWLLFPEKINGKYAILHSITPKILIDYVDDFNCFRKGFCVRSNPPEGGREGFWDNWVRGAGAPPIKTAEGWLLLYHAMDKNDPGKYKIGAMILDKNKPTKILYRSPSPILDPSMPYENDGKPGVVYASGAVVKDDILFVYYGGGDKVVCVATTPLKSLINWLKKQGSPAPVWSLN